MTPPPPPPPLGICGSIAAAAARIFGLVLLTTALAGAFAFALQPESVKPQNFAFANLLAAPAFAQEVCGGTLPNPHFPEQAHNEGLSLSDFNAFNGHCQQVGEVGRYQRGSVTGSACILPSSQIHATTGESFSKCFYSWGQQFPLTLMAYMRSVGLGDFVLEEGGFGGSCREAIASCAGYNMPGNPFSGCDLSQRDPCLNEISLSPSAGGTVSVSWSGDSDAQSGELVPDGATVTFTALPEDGYGFSLWTGACADESDSPCVLAAVTTDVTVGAEFELMRFEVSLAASPGGTVSAGWQGDADLPSGGTVPFGATVTFTATPADGYRFSLWTGACADETDSPCVLAAVTMDATVGAEFGCLDFHESAAMGNLAGLKCNTDAGADVNAPDESGRTPLHLAAGEGHLEVVQELLTLGATLNAVDADGKTPLTEAANGDHMEIFDLLAAAGGMCGANEMIANGTCECDSDHRRISESCIHPENRLPEDETTCADAFGGEWVDLSAEHGEGKGVCSGIDINDTFCLAGTGSALPCLGLFNHVRSCNLLGRPALDPWHCAAACAGGKASGARCLE